MSMTEEGDSKAPLAVVIGLSREAVPLSFLPKQVLHHFESMQNVRTRYVPICTYMYASASSRKGSFACLIDWRNT